MAGGSSGGCAAVAFAARFPERVDRLLFYGAYADGSSLTSPQVGEAVVATLRSHWGLGSRVLADIFFGRVRQCRAGAARAHQRAAASPETAAAMLELLYRVMSGRVGTGYGHRRWSCTAAATARSRTGSAGNSRR